MILAALKEAQFKLQLAFDLLWGEEHDDEADGCLAAKRAVTAAIAAREAEGWQPIETAPRDSVSRLVWCPDMRNIYAVVWADFGDVKGWHYFGGEGLLLETPTHWRLMPAPPSAP